MKLEVNLDELALDDLGGTLGEAIRDEIVSAARAEVRRTLKEEGQKFIAEIHAATVEGMKKADPKALQKIWVDAELTRWTTR